MPTLEIISHSFGSGRLHSKRCFFFPPKIGQLWFGWLWQFKMIPGQIWWHGGGCHSAQLYASSSIRNFSSLSLVNLWYRSICASKHFSSLLHQLFSISFIKYLVVNCMYFCNIIKLSTLHFLLWIHYAWSLFMYTGCFANQQKGLCLIVNHFYSDFLATHIYCCFRYTL